MCCGQKKKYRMIVFDMRWQTFDLEAGFTFWPANSSMGSQDKTCKQLLREKKWNFFEWRNFIIQTPVQDIYSWYKKHLKVIKCLKKLVYSRAAGAGWNSGFHLSSADSLRPFISYHIPSKHIRETHRTKKRGRTYFIHTVEKRPVRRTAADTLAKVQQVAATELHTAEGWNEFLNVLQHFSGRDWWGKSVTPSGWYHR